MVTFRLDMTPREWEEIHEGYRITVECPRCKRTQIVLDWPQRVEGRGRTKCAHCAKRLFRGQDMEGLIALWRMTSVSGMANVRAAAQDLLRR